MFINMADNTCNDSTILEDTEVPYVLCCSKCRVIFGDSLNILQVNTELKIVSLQMVTDVLEITNDCNTSVKGPDIGSSYNIIKCKSCRSSVGRCYKTTPKSLDIIRDVYTLDLNSVKSYELGKGITNNNHFVGPIEKLSEIIFKTQSLVVSLNERIEKLESLVQDVDSSDDSEQEIKQKKRKLN